MWAAAEAQTEPSSLVFKKTVCVRFVGPPDSEKEAPAPPPKLTTPQIAELVLLIMKNQSRREENALTSAERERLQAAQVLYAPDWPCWEQYAARMRKLLRERNKRRAA